MDIRGSGEQPVSIIEADTGRLLGTVDGDAAHSTVHDGALYVHRGETFVVDEFDVEDACAVVHPESPEWTTVARDITDLGIVSIDRTRRLGTVTAHTGVVDVTNQVVAYQRRRLGTGEVLAEFPLDLPARQLRTRAVWLTLDERAVERAEVDEVELPGSLHAAEHAAIGILPLLATCDRWDLGGLSTALHPDTGAATIFVYDGHPGGAGFAERGFAVLRRWLQATRATVASCECESGCPSCVQSPKCGNGNDPLDKAGAVRVLDVVLDELADVEGPMEDSPTTTPRTTPPAEAPTAGRPGRPGCGRSPRTTPSRPSRTGTRTRDLHDGAVVDPAPGQLRGVGLRHPSGDGAGVGSALAPRGRPRPAPPGRPPPWPGAGRPPRRRPGRPRRRPSPAPPPGRAPTPSPTRAPPSAAPSVRVIPSPGSRAATASADTVSRSGTGPRAAMRAETVTRTSSLPHRDGGRRPVGGGPGDQRLDDRRRLAPRRRPRPLPGGVDAAELRAHDGHRRHGAREHQEQDRQDDGGLRGDHPGLAAPARPADAASVRTASRARTRRGRSAR